MPDLTPTQARMLSAPIDFSRFIDRDQQANAVAWSLDQFRDKAVYLQVLQAFVDEANELYVAICELGRARTIASAEGVWLNGIGRIVGQPRETTPTDLPDSFFYWDDDLSGGYSQAVPADTTAHYMDSSTQWVTGATVNTNGVPTDADYRTQIIRRVTQNMNQHSSASEISNAILTTLGIHAHVIASGYREITINVPAGTPDWMKYYLTGKTFDYTTHGYTRWWFPYPACIKTVTIGTY